MPAHPSTSHSDQNETLDADHLAVVSALGGTNSGLSMLRAHVKATGGEERPQQELMLSRVVGAIESKQHLLVQAGTGTGKSLAYAFAAAAAGRRTVIATATNQLSEQLMRKDLPQVAALMEKQKRPLTFVVLKGRNQYACKARISESRALGGGTDAVISLLEDESDVSELAQQGQQFARLMTWAGTTESGERSEAPPVADAVWRQLSVSSAECARSDCPFYGECFAEKARQSARKADIIVTNHALLAQDIRMSSTNEEEGTPGVLLPPHEVLVIDEAHGFANTLGEALSTRIDVDAMRARVRKARRSLDISDTVHTTLLTHCADALDSLEESIREVELGPLPQLPSNLQRDLEHATVQLLTLSRSLRDTSAAFSKAGKTRQAVSALLLGNQIDEDAVCVSRCRTTPEGSVRWIESTNPEATPRICIAPVDVGAVFVDALDDRTVIGTSATLKVGGDFSVQQRSLGLIDCSTEDVGTPFHYPQQGMLYIPSPPFPEPVGKDRLEHTAAVKDELRALIEAAGGRTLALFTTSSAATNSAKYLRAQFPSLTVLAHGEATAESLVQQFAEDETSILCATMGMWQGVSVEGSPCSLVVIDKLSFPPPDDPLIQARREFAEECGRDGFNEVFVAKAAIDVAQAAGRLIRTSTDRGVVAILDPRLLTKRYGRTLIASLPPFPLYTDRTVVTDALRRLTGGLDDALPKNRKRATQKASGPAKTAPRQPAGKRRVPKTPPQRRKGAAPHADK